MPGCLSFSHFAYIQLDIVEFENKKLFRKAKLFVKSFKRRFFIDGKSYTTLSLCKENIK
jgi:hypothetical protein